MKATSYTSAHDRIRRLKGPASEQLCVCGERAQGWAYTHDDPCPWEQVSPEGLRFSHDPDRYVAMCALCHNRYDKPLITECPAGHKYTPANTIIDGGKRKCKTCVYKRNRERELTPNQRARRIQRQRERRAENRKSGISSRGTPLKRGIQQG
jgi:hypothetical protein